jgi:hypothetical protein
VFVTVECSESLSASSESHDWRVNVAVAGLCVVDEYTEHRGGSIAVRIQFV